MKDVSWEEAARSCNNLFMRFHSKKKINNYVKDCCNNALPFALTQMLATAMVKGLTHEDEDIKVVINAYEQLEDKGYIGNRV